jgi:FKBP-type peptidyl-prolyl cis-trans isomerase
MAPVPVSEELKVYAPDENDDVLTDILPTVSAVDSVSYLWGVNCGMPLKANKMFETPDEVNLEMFIAGFEDAINAGMPASMGWGMQDEEWAQKFEIDQYTMDAAFNAYLASRQAYNSKYNEILGQNFLAENKTKEGVQETESGLQYIIHAEGEGEKIKPEDTVCVNYKGTLIDGTEFDANDGIEFPVNGVIKGWTEGLGLLAKGGKATFFIPGELAYGANPPYGSIIEPNSTLIFEVEVVDVIRPEVVEAE